MAWGSGAAAAFDDAGAAFAIATTRTAPRVGRAVWWCRAGHLPVEPVSARAGAATAALMSAAIVQRASREAVERTSSPAIMQLRQTKIAPV